MKFVFYLKDHEPTIVFFEWQSADANFVPEDFEFDNLLICHGWSIGMLLPGRLE